MLAWGGGDLGTSGLGDEDNITRHPYVAQKEEWGGVNVPRHCPEGAMRRREGSPLSLPPQPGPCQLWPQARGQHPPKECQGLLVPSGSQPQAQDTVRQATTSSESLCGPLGARPGQCRHQPGWPGMDTPPLLTVPPATRAWDRGSIVGGPLSVDPMAGGPTHTQGWAGARTCRQQVEMRGAGVELGLELTFPSPH